ncbi:MAG: DUF1592 domain-containing protein [Opitutaceae bacterium]
MNARDASGLARFRQAVSPILEQHCYECHGNGAKKAGLAFDELTSAQQILHNPELWLKVLRNTRSHIMPPPEETQPTAAEQSALEKWIVAEGFGLDPARPDPGRVTVRRLNRAEYQNTIRDLLGVDFDAEALLAADDIGYGFDNISDVLTLSPMRMEKFISAAQEVVKKGVPEDFRAISELTAVGKDFTSEDGRLGDVMTYYEERKVTHTFKVPVAGEYRVIMAVSVDGRTNPDPGRVRVTVSRDGEDFHTKEYKWADCGFFSEELALKFTAGEHRFQFHVEPLEAKEKQKGKMDFRIDRVQLVGPADRKDWLPAANYARFFPRPQAPQNADARRAYAREVLTIFATKAYRRPQSDAVIDRLVKLAESFHTTPGHTFEFAIGRAMVAVLASPRFLFRFEENARGATPDTRFVDVDEYSLASRLSYFLWSSTPDDALLRLAQRGELRKNLPAQVKRMLADPKASALVRNFTGQWLLSKDILHVPLNLPIVLAREGLKPAPVRRAPGAFGPAASVTDVTLAQREALKAEAEAYFDYVARADRNLLELIDSDYAFLNETLANYYGLPADSVKGAELRRVVVSTDDPRGGGVLTMGSTLAVTSNPTRTSPVKRGKWILENILGAPAPPPPPAVPSLEDTEKRIPGRTPTQRELLAIHREDALCASCHARMDPLGLALENFNALGLYRTRELDQPVDATGTLMTGEAFKNIRELKRILATQHEVEIYRTITEKLLVYALGRGAEYYDVPAIDRIVERLQANDGRFSALLMGVIESVPFQQRRAVADSPSRDAQPLITSRE